MFTGSFDYMVCLTDPKHFNRIYCSLTAPITQYAKMTVTCLTSNCAIANFSETDYITSKQITIYYSNGKYNSLSVEIFVRILKNDILTLINNVHLDTISRLVIGQEHEFAIEDMSYNIKLITWFYNADFPIKAEYDINLMYYVVRAESVGMNLSTPVLYLISNIGMQSYKNNKTETDTNVCGAKIVMRLNNSFCAAVPIVVNNADFETTILSNNLSCLEFTLVDANMHEIELLSHLYLSIHVDAIPDIIIPDIEQKK